MSHPEPALKPEIGHVLFLDLVGYSKEATTSQTRLIAGLNSAVSSSPTFSAAKTDGNVLPLATGDGMALVFFDDVTLPARCAVELSKALTEAGLPTRMGIHSGLVQRQRDIAGNENVAGEGINTAQRVMSFGDAGHILVSGQYAGWLEQFDEWRPHVRHVGEYKSKHDVSIHVASLCGSGFGREDTPNGAGQRITPSSPVSELKIVALYKRKAQPDEQVLNAIEEQLGSLGHQVFIDRHLKIGVEWAKAIEERIRASDAVIAILSDASVGSEMLEYELEIAADEFRKRGKPHLLPVRIGTDRPLDGVIGSIVNKLHFTVWSGAEDNRRVVAELLSALTEPEKPKTEETVLEPVGGAVPPDSPFYIERQADAEFASALRAHESIVLVKGPRQIGKTSLIGRGAKLVRELGYRHAMTDFQKLSMAQLSSEDTFYKLLAATLARQLKFQYDFSAEWLDIFGANMNLENFIRAFVESDTRPLVWFMDEADKLFGTPFASDFFGLVRSWHNSRATDPEGPWGRFTVVIGYATEAHLFIQDLNQSPFNVGRQIELPDFSCEQTEQANKSYGSPIESRADVQKLHSLIGGQPFLTRRALDVLARKQMDLSTLFSTASRDDGPFGDHLKRILISVSQLPSVLEALRISMTNPEFRDSEGYQRLLSAGVVKKNSDNRAELRCELYRQYLASHV